MTAGPVTGSFIQPDNKPIFTMIPRFMELSLAAGCITKTYDNNILCLYYEREKNLINNSGETPFIPSKSEDMVLAVAIFDDKGNIITRKK